MYNQDQYQDKEGVLLIYLFIEYAKSTSDNLRNSDEFDLNYIDQDLIDH